MNIWLIIILYIKIINLKIYNIYFKLELERITKDIRKWDSLHRLEWIHIDFGLKSGLFISEWIILKRVIW